MTTIEQAREVAAGTTIDALIAELDALKSQPPVAVFNMAINESVGAICYDFAKHKLPSGTKFYLAPGALP